MNIVIRLITMKTNICYKLIFPSRLNHYIHVYVEMRDTYILCKHVLYLETE